MNTVVDQTHTATSAPIGAASTVPLGTESTATPSWQQELRDAYQSVEELVADGYMAAPLHSDDEHAEINERYKLRLPRYYAALIDKNDPHCPIAAQALPRVEELDPVLSGELLRVSTEIYDRDTPWTADAIGDVARLAAPRLTHRYGNRALLHVTTSCALYCRFCFRKAHMGNHEEALYNGDYAQALSYLSAHTEIREIILTGGDPLSLTDAALKSLILKLVTAAPHLRVIRIHTRMPVTLPSRITAELVRVLVEATTADLRIVVVTHFNHSKELTVVAKEKLRVLIGAGVPVYNQSVLLRGVNNRAETLAELFSALYELGVRPMYLHHPDYTPGTFHFRVSISEGRRIYRALRGVCAGPALPRYVLDVPGGGGKTDIIDEDFVRLDDLRSMETNTGPIGAALYQVPLSATNESPVARYLDLFPATDGL